MINLSVHHYFRIIVLVIGSGGKEAVEVVIVGVGGLDAVHISFYPQVKFETKLVPRSLQ